MGTMLTAPATETADPIEIDPSRPHEAEPSAFTTPRGNPDADTHDVERGIEKLFRICGN